MASPTTKRTRSERVASLQLEPSSLHRWSRQFLTGRSLLRIGLAVIAALMIVVIMQGWRPAFAYRESQIPQRDIVARVAFDVVDAGQTELLRKQKRREVLCFYENRAQPISQLISTIKNKFSSLLGDTPYAELSAEQRRTLAEIMPTSVGDEDLTEAEALTRIRQLLDERTKLEGGKFDQALKAVLDPIAETGVLKSIDHDSEQGNQRSIIVFPAGLPEDRVFVDVPKVRHAEIVAELPQKVTERFQQVFNTPDAVIIARMVSKYIVANLPVTLTYQQNLSEEARAKAEDSVQDAILSYYPTVSKLAQAGQPMTRDKELPLLRAEYEAWVQQLTWGETVLRLAAFTGMLLALYLLCGLYIYFQYDRRLLTDTAQLLRLLGLVVVTCLLARFASPDPIRAEVVPLVLCAMTMTMTFGRQVALLVTTCIAMALTLGLGLDIGEFVTLCSGTCASALLLGRIRTRTKLIYVGLAAGAIVAMTHLGVDIVLGKLDLTVPDGGDGSILPKREWTGLLSVLAGESFRLGGFTLLAGALMYSLLPFAEHIFGVQTDLSLLELGDASHPLLRQLAQRAPGTYNHSINVAAIAEAAADSIGAHGLLTRVGAYFHDIGKMFKPNYFVENQEQGGNCHDSLQPAMSTLVIIAHVKDGADLGRKNRLPKPIVDFIEQHHGTTLVEYFYREAAKRSQNDPNREEVSETSFRYPGPKPQTLEAAVLMLADSVESASRTLVEPTSSRIQNLVDQIAMKKLLDGQFDQCGLTLQQLDQVKSSLVKSLTAIYHGRVKYTGQASA
jgi:cyclic-di-AMP phosphodiesterase PgpH